MQTYLVDIDDTVYSRTYQLDDALTTLPYITPFDFVQDFCERHTTVFVSKGDPLLQMRKLRILGLLHTADSVHIVQKNVDKRIAFELYKSAIVIGNRRDAEVRQGNLAGHKTVLIKHGKYACMPIEGPHDVANIEVDTFADFINYK